MIHSIYALYTIQTVVVVVFVALVHLLIQLLNVLIHGGQMFGFPNGFRSSSNVCSVCSS